jgi:hypothetical protein
MGANGHHTTNKHFIIGIIAGLPLCVCRPIATLVMGRIQVRDLIIYISRTYKKSVKDTPAEYIYPNLHT